jgi:hypothetical protein
MRAVTGPRYAQVDERDRAAFQALLNALLPSIHGPVPGLGPQEAGHLLDDLLARHQDLQSDVLRGLRKAANAAVADAMEELSRTDEPAWEAVRLVALAAFYQQPEVLRHFEVPNPTSSASETAPPSWLTQRPTDVLTHAHDDEARDDSSLPATPRPR